MAELDRPHGISVSRYRAVQHRRSLLPGAGHRRASPGIRGRRLGPAAARRLSNRRAGLVPRRARQHRRRLRGPGLVRSDARLDAEAARAILPRTGRARGAARAQPSRRALRAAHLALLAQHSPAARSPDQSLRREKAGWSLAPAARAAAFANHRRDAALERAAPPPGDAQAAGQEALRPDQSAGGAGKRQAGADADRRPRRRARALSAAAAAAGGRADLAARISLAAVGGRRPSIAGWRRLTARSPSSS